MKLDTAELSQIIRLWTIQKDITVRMSMSSKKHNVRVLGESVTESVTNKINELLERNRY